MNYLCIDCKTENLIEAEGDDMLYCKKCDKTYHQNKIKSFWLGYDRACVNLGYKTLTETIRKFLLKGK